MANRARRLTVGATAVPITGTDDFRLGQSPMIRPIGGDICIGGPDVSMGTGSSDVTAKGFLVKDGEIFSDENVDAPVYAISAGSVVVHVYNGGVA